jgi:basic membrane protein A
MLKGEFGRFDVFAGPINDNTGKEILAAGEKLEQADLDQFPNAAGDNCETCMNWLVEGINGTIPASQ